MQNRVIAAVLMAALATAPALAQQARAAGQDGASPPPGAMPGAGRGPMGGGMGMLRMADANGDGVVTREEYMAAVDARFARMDVNHDGVLSPDEMPRRGGRFGPGGGDAPPAPPPAGFSPGATGTPPAPPPQGNRPPETRDQYRAAAMRRFDRIDANHDGRIDQAEMAAIPAMPPRRGMGDMPPAEPSGQ